MTDERQELGQLAARAEETIDRIQWKAGEDDLGSTLSLLDDLEDIIDEAEDVLSTLDLSDVVGAVEWETVPDAIDASDLREAISEGDGSDAVSTRELLDLVDLSALMDSVEVRELWRQKRELEDELDDVVGDGSDDRSFDVDVDPIDGTGHDVDPEAVQTAVQSEISDGVGGFREKLIAAHHRLRELREENEARFETRRREMDSRNPTAGFSTVPGRPVGRGVTARYSTVPEETKYSTAPNRRRIYGDRFESAGGVDGE